MNLIKSGIVEQTSVCGRRCCGTTVPSCVYTGGWPKYIKKKIIKKIPVVLGITNH